VRYDPSGLRDFPRSENGHPALPVAAQEPNDHIAVILSRNRRQSIPRRKAAISIGIGAVVFMIGAMIFGH
jgi:hypothetical protein